MKKCVLPLLLYINDKIYQRASKSHPLSKTVAKVFHLNNYVSNY